jgi:dihydrofolate synthase/folylpolyglutamate synthase
LNENSKVDAFGNVDMAYKQALINAQSNDIILVMGSFLTVAAVLAYHASA